MENVWEKLKALKGRPWTDTKNILNKFMKEACHVEEIVRTYRINSETLPEKDREIYGLYLKNEPFFLERCKLCSRLLKPSVIDYHHDVHHKKNVTCATNGTTPKKFSFISPNKKKYSKKGSKSTSEDDSESIISSATSSPVIDLQETQSNDSNIGIIRDDSIIDVISVEELPSEDSKPPTPGPQDLYEEFAVPCVETVPSTFSSTAEASEYSRSCSSSSSKSSLKLKIISAKEATVSNVKSQGTSLLEAHLLSNIRYNTNNCGGSLANVDTKSKTKASFKLTSATLSKGYRENGVGNDKHYTTTTEVGENELPAVADQSSNTWRSFLGQQNGSMSTVSKTKTETKISIPISALPQNVKIISSLKKGGSSRTTAAATNLLKNSGGQKIVALVGSKEKVAYSSRPSSPLSYGVCAVAAASENNNTCELPYSELNKEKAPSKSSKKSKKSSKVKNRWTKNADFNPDKHCGVLIDENRHCVRSLTCKTHPISQRRAVEGRSKEFDKLLADHRASKDSMKDHGRNHQNLNLTEPIISIPMLPVDKISGNTIEILSANNEAETIKIRVPNFITQSENRQKHLNGNTATNITSIAATTNATTSTTITSSVITTIANDTAFTSSTSATIPTLTIITSDTNNITADTTINMTTTTNGTGGIVASRKKENEILIHQNIPNTVNVASTSASLSMTAAVSNSYSSVYTKLATANVDLATCLPLDHQKTRLTSQTNVTGGLATQLFDNDVKISFVCSDMLYKVGGLLYTDRSRQAIRKCMTPLIAQTGVQLKTAKTLHPRRKITDFLQLVKNKAAYPSIKLNLFKDENSENKLSVPEDRSIMTEMKLENSHEEVQRMKNVLTNSSKVLSNLSADENELRKLRLTRFKRPATCTTEKYANDIETGGCHRKSRRHCDAEETHVVANLFSFDDSSWSRSDGMSVGIDICLENHFPCQSGSNDDVAVAATEQFPMAVPTFDVPYTSDVTPASLATTLALTHQSARLGMLQESPQYSDNARNRSASGTIETLVNSPFNVTNANHDEKNAALSEDYLQRDAAAAAAAAQLLKTFQELEKEICGPTVSSNSSHQLYLTQQPVIVTATNTTTSSTATTTMSGVTTLLSANCNTTSENIISFENVAINPYIEYVNGVGDSNANDSANTFKGNDDRRVDVSVSGSHDGVAGTPNGDILVDGNTSNIEETISKNYSLLEEYCKNIATNHLFLDDKANYEYYDNGETGVPVEVDSVIATIPSAGHTLASSNNVAAVCKLDEDDLIIVKDSIFTGVNTALEDANLTPVELSNRTIDPQILTSYLSSISTNICSVPNIVTGTVVAAASTSSVPVFVRARVSPDVTAGTSTISATSTNDVNFVTEQFDVQMHSEIPKQVLTNERTYDEILALNKQFQDNAAVKTEKPPTPNTALLDARDNEALNWLF